MKNQILNYIIDHPKHNAISCATILGFIVNLDLNQIANTITLSIISAISGYIATKILERFLKRIKAKDEKWKLNGKKDLTSFHT